MGNRFFNGNMSKMCVLLDQFMSSLIAHFFRVTMSLPLDHEKINT